MNIYLCEQNFSGYLLSAAVQAENPAQAISLLMWFEDEDTKDIKAECIGTAFGVVAKVLVEESL